MTRRAANLRSSSSGSEGSPNPADPQLNSNQNNKSRTMDWKRFDWCIRTGLVLSMGLGFIFITVQLLFPELHERLWTRTTHREGIEELDHRQSETALMHSGDDSANYFFSDFMHGNWIIGQSSWKFSSRDVVEVTEEMFSTPPLESRKPDSQFDDQTIVEILNAFNAKQVAIETPAEIFTYWRLSTINGIEASVFTERTDGQQVVQLFRVALPTDTGFQFVEGLPRPPTGTEGELLLPACKELEQIAVRMDERGGPSSAMMGLQGDLDQVLQHWRSCGWLVNKVNLAASRSVQFECRKGNQFIQGTVLELAPQKRALLLVRIPKSLEE